MNKTQNHSCLATRQTWPGQQDPRGLGASPRPRARGSTINTPGPTSGRPSKSHDRKSREAPPGPVQPHAQPSGVGVPFAGAQAELTEVGDPRPDSGIHLRQRRSDTRSPLLDGGLGRYTAPPPGSARPPSETPPPSRTHSLGVPTTRYCPEPARPPPPRVPCPGPPFLSGAEGLGTPAARNRARGQACQSWTTRC